MAEQPPLAADEILTPDGVRVQLRVPSAPADGRAEPAGSAAVPPALLALAAVPVLAAAATGLAALAVAATGAEVARRLLRPWSGWSPDATAGPGLEFVTVSWTYVAVRRSPGR